MQRSGLDPLAHFLLYGAPEQRQPNAAFDVRHYLAAYPDVAAARVNPLLHFLRYGWKEGRRPNILFDPAFYEARYPQRRYRNPFVDYLVRRQRGEKPLQHLPFSLPLESYQVATTKLSVVDIIIPVYSGLEATRRCLQSLLASISQTPCEIVLVNDHAPDPALTRYLRQAAATHHLTLLENPHNLGFAASVNRGMDLHLDRDVILLNNDTEVASDWLDRLVSAAYAADSPPDTRPIATVTPFSNHATICSYPQGAIPTAELDAIFRQVNAGHRVDIPTAVGFCMFIRRDCLNEVGAFRPDIFGKGYGEENDFCLRALYKGWRHVLAANVFVYHAGETSFGAEAEDRRKAGVQIVERLYPDYGRMIADHQRADPARPYRIAVSARRMRQSGKPVILAVSHNLGGGVAQHISELHQLLDGRAAMLLLTPASSEAVLLRNLDPTDDFSVAFDLESDYPALLELLRHCGVSRIHIHHLLGHTLDLARLRQDLDVPMDFTLHDYFVICPQVTLTDAAGRYCGEPDAAGCRACLAIRPITRLDIAAWRGKHAALLSHADRLIAPSRDTANRFRRYLPAANIVVAPHPSHSSQAPAPPVPDPDQPLVIAVLGAMTQHKGIGRLRAVAGIARSRNLPLQFVLAGYANQPPAAAEPFLQTGPYAHVELPALLRKAGAHVVWFPPQWPETFSYTLSACLELGLPVVAPNLGAFAERLAGRAWTWIVPWDWDPQRMLDFFLTVRRDHFLTGLPPPVPPSEESLAPAEFYPVKYLY